MAQENEYISSAAETMFESSQDESMRYFLEGVEEANRIRRGHEIRMEQAAAALSRKEALIAEKEATIVEMDEIIAEKDATISEKNEVIAEKDRHIAKIEAELARLRSHHENK